MSFPFEPLTAALPRKRIRAAAIAAGIGLSLAVTPVLFGQTASPALSQEALQQRLPSFGPLAKKVLPAVVNISVQTRVEEFQGSEFDQPDQMSPGEGPDQGSPSSPFDEFLRRFFDQQGPGGDLQGPRGMRPRNAPRATALGSGFIIDPQGYVVTNAHVVRNADKVTVIFQDDSRHPAKVVGRDTKTDVALLKITTDKPLPYVSFGDSSAVGVGDWVMAVGNPFGLGGTISSGIISARGRDIHSGPYDDYLQIDASINRGNSGGPTFNLDGQVVGINTAIYSPNGGSVGIGFAIPSNQAKLVVEQLRSHGKVERGWLGVQIQQVTPEIASSLGLPKAEGALVADVTPNGPAAKAGFHQGDVIETFDGHAIDKVRDLPIVVAETKVGEKADVKVWRKDGETTLHPTIATMPENLQTSQNDEAAPDVQQGESSSALGLRLAPLTQDVRQRLHIGRNVKGVVVTGVSDTSPLADLGIQAGDVIQAINQEPVSTPAEVAQKLKEARDTNGKFKNVLVLLNRRGINQYVALSESDNG